MKILLTLFVLSLREKKGFRKGWFECGVYRIILPNDHAIFCVTLTRSSQSRPNFQIDFVFLPEHIQLWACGSIRDLDKGIVGHGRKRQNPKFENTKWGQDLNSPIYQFSQLKMSRFYRTHVRSMS